MLADMTVGDIVTVIVIPAAGALAGVVGYLFKLYVDELKSSRASWIKIAEGGLKVGGEVVTNQLKSIGHPIVAEIAPVLAEHNSPTTAKQEDTAALATANAKLAAITLAAQKLVETTTHTVSNGPVEVTVVPADKPLPVEVVKDKK